MEGVGAITGKRVCRKGSGVGRGDGRVGDAGGEEKGALISGRGEGN